jgi:hypothetical protein
MRRFLNFIIIIAIFILAGIIVNDHFLVKKKVERKRINVKITKSQDILAKKNSLPMELINTTTTSSVCTLFMKMSAEKSFSEFKGDVINHLNDKIIETCSGALPKKLDKSLTSMKEQCKSATPNSIDYLCEDLILKSQNQIVATIIKHDAPIDHLPSNILLHLLANSYDEGSLYDSPEKNLDYIDTLINLEPNFLEGLKLKLLIIANSSLAKKPYYQEVFQKTLHLALSMTDNNREYLEIEIAMKGDILNSNNENKTPTNEFIEFLDQQTLENPKEWIYLYYRAFAHYLSGKDHYQECLKSLQKAQGLAPNEERIKSALSKLNTPIDSKEDLKKDSPFSVDTKFSLAN